MGSLRGTKQKGGIGVQGVGMGVIIYLPSGLGTYTYLLVYVGTAVSHEVNGYPLESLMT